MPDVVIGEVAKNPVEKLVVAIREFKGHTFIDIRTYFLGDDEAWHPTRKGVTVSPDEVDTLLNALSTVKARLGISAHISATRAHAASR